jgi:carotenoid cleavage dioxygenase-like enzyme
MAVARSRSSADMLRDLKATEQRLDGLVTRWRSHATTGNLAQAHIMKVPGLVLNHDFAVSERYLVCILPAKSRV